MKPESPQFRPPVIFKLRRIIVVVRFLSFWPIFFAGGGRVSHHPNAAKAIGEFNGLNIEGRALQVNEARPQESRGGGHRSGNGRGFYGGRSGRGGRRNY
jgi:hypothetical protein